MRPWQANLRRRSPSLFGLPCLEVWQHWGSTLLVLPPPAHASMLHGRCCELDPPLPRGMNRAGPCVVCVGALVMMSTPTAARKKEENKGAAELSDPDRRRRQRGQYPSPHSTPQIAVDRVADGVQPRHGTGHWRLTRTRTRWARLDVLYRAPLRRTRVRKPRTDPPLPEVSAPQASTSGRGTWDLLVTSAAGVQSQSQNTYSA